MHALARGALLALLGTTAAAQTTLQLDDMSGVRGLVCTGVLGLSGPPAEPVVGELGRSSAVADLNNDGFDDLIVGAPLLPTAPATGVLDEAGHAFILFGSADKGLPGSSPDFDFSSFSQGQAIDLVGNPGDRAGTSVAAVGDVDGDGFQDVAIGAPNHTLGSRTAAGGAYIVLGSADLPTLPKVVLLSSMAASSANRALFLQGAREFSVTGSSVGGDVDCDNDGFDDVLLGAPLDSTNGHTQNGTATVFYGRPGLGALNILDLATQGAGQVTVVHGAIDFQFMGFAVAGIGKFDPVLPMSTQFDLASGDDVALGAPGTTVGTAFLAGAVYVLRGIASGTAATSYTTDDFGNGPSKAGIAYTGATAGDQLGFWLAGAGDIVALDAEGFAEFLVTAPFNDGLGKPDCGAAYVLVGRLAGQNPQGFSVSLLGQGSASAPGIYIQGAVTAGGQQGVWAASAGDWNGDGLVDIAVGFPNVATFDGQVHAAAGRARLLDGSKVLFTLGTVDLADPFASWDLMQFLGEVTGAHAGSGLAMGDFNGDGSSDLSVGAFGAPSDPSPFDPTGLAHVATGRAHVVYGPIVRLVSASPAASWFAGPPVALSVLNLPATGTVTVELDGLIATVTSVTPGDIGTIVIKPPPPAVKGALADVAIGTSAGDVLVKDSLQYVPLSIATGPTPSSGFPGSSVAFTGQAFSTVPNTVVTVGGFPATVAAVDGLGGTLSVTLPSGPPLDVPLTVVVTNANGSVTLPGALSYLPITVQSVVPSQAPQDSGVFFAGAVPYEGEPPTVVQVTVESSLGPPPPNPLVEFGTAALGFRTATVTGVSGSVITCEVPPFLLGPQTLVDVRVTFGGETGFLTNGFTYLESDFKELNEFSLPGFGTLPPRALMAGQFTNGANVLFRADQIAAQTQVTILFLGLGLVTSPPVVHGGLFPIDVGKPFYTFFLPPLPSVAISQTMPTDIDPISDGVSLYIHVVTKEKSGAVTEWGFSNVLQMTIDV